VNSLDYFRFSNTMTRDDVVLFAISGESLIKQHSIIYDLYVTMTMDIKRRLSNIVYVVIHRILNLPHSYTVNEPHRFQNYIWSYSNYEQKLKH